MFNFDLKIMFPASKLKEALAIRKVSLMFLSKETITLKNVAKFLGAEVDIVLTFDSRTKARTYITRDILGNKKILLLNGRK